MKEKRTLWQKIRSPKLNIKFTVLILFLIFIPLTILSLFMFSQIEKNALKQRESDMYYRQREMENAVNLRIEAMETLQRSFANDDELLHLLEKSADNESVTIEELLDFSGGIGAFLTEIVENNPIVYTVRVYAINDEIQEIMPIIYKASRMEKMSWSKEKPKTGWHFEYYDTSFGNLTENRDVPLLGMVTPVNDISYGTVGFTETATEMRTIFPGMYDEADEEENWGFFAIRGGDQYFGPDRSEQSREIAAVLSEDVRIFQESFVGTRSVADREILFYTVPIHTMDGAYVEVSDVTGLIGEARTQRNTYFAVMGIFFVLMAFAINGLVKGLLKRLYAVVENMRAIRDGDMSVRADVNGTMDEVGELSVQFNRMLDQIEILTKENVQREILAKNAGIRSLQNQINAHFIYNVLESIKMMAEMREEYEISDAITSLGKLLRYSMRWESGTVTMQEELDYIENYLALMNFRNDFIVTLAKNLPEDMLLQEIPKMSLQPIVENSVLHGIAPLGEDASIYIKGIEKEDEVWIELSDNGQGMSEEVLSRLRQKLEGAVETEEVSHKGHGVGIKNVADRIMLEFGKDYGLTVLSEEGKYTKTVMHLPKRKGKYHEIVADRRR